MSHSICSENQLVHKYPAHTISPFPFLCTKAFSFLFFYLFFMVCIKAKGLPLARLCTCPYLPLACTCFSSRRVLVGPQNLVNDPSVGRETAPNLFSFKRISFPVISLGIILHVWILCYRNSYVANITAIVRYCIYTC